MRSIRRASCALTVAAAAVASLLGTAGNAAAVSCKAPSGKYCVAVYNHDPKIKSARLNGGRCLLGPMGTTGYTYYPSVQKYLGEMWSISAYSKDTKCGGSVYYAYTFESFGVDDKTNTFTDGRWAVINIG